MKQTNHSPQFLRRRRFMLVLPLLTVPFLTGLLWALKSEGKDEKKTAVIKRRHGINAEVPGARLKDDKADKMDFYEAAELDSMKKGEKRRSEAMYERRLADSGAGRAVQGYKDPNEERANRKLQELNTVLQMQPEQVAVPVGKQAGLAGRDPLPSAGLDRLEKMMEQMRGGKESNPEMQEMNGVLDKLIRVQHPEWGRDSLRERSAQNRPGALPVKRALDSASVSLMGYDHEAGSSLLSTTGRFYGLDDTTAKAAASNVLEALVPETQALVSGATVKLELVNEAMVKGIIIPAGTPLYGVATLNNERLVIGIHSIRTGDQFLPVDLLVYDGDGLEGIHVPGAISRDVMKQSADQGVNSFGIGAYDPSIGGQAASAGIQLAKNMVTRKVKLVRVTVEAGYRVWLKDGKQR